MDVRRILQIRGVVQGVGFRPFVYRAALRLGLRGAVWNEPSGVVVDAEGDADALDSLVLEISNTPPPRAAVAAVSVRDAPLAHAATFSIRRSEESAPTAPRVSADLATCAACLSELNDP